MNVLILNCGSSSLKFQVIRTSLDDIATNTDKALASGIIERIGSQSLITFKNLETGATRKSATPIRDHRAAIDQVLRWLVSPEAQIPGITTLSDINAVGHRVVHGGEKFSKSVVIDSEVLKALEDMIDLAPLHNPANIAGIRAAIEVLGAGIAQAAVFDTAFHHTLPEHAYLYAIPYQYYRRYRVRRYGFHGTSHRYVSYRYRMIRNIPREQVYAITMHLGNGCSACAIAGGNSIDTSMGMTPLEGLVMGTRAGDIDPAIMDYIAQKEGIGLHEIESILNRSSGLLGISGLTHDMRELIDEDREHQDRRARLAMEIFCYRARKYIGAYLTSILSTGAQPDRIAIIFTGGIGENSPKIRKQICDGLGWLGLSLDASLNEQMIGGKEGVIGHEGSRLMPYVIPTNEELLIARDTIRAIHHIPQRY
jgi:acetate kinase